MSDNEEVSLIRTKKPHKNLKAVNAMPPEEPKVAMPEPKVAMPEPKEALPEPNVAMSEPKVKKQRPPKTEKQLEASKKMLEARRLQCQKIKEEKLAKQYEAFQKVENKVTLKRPEPVKAPVKEHSDTEDTEEEEEEIIVVKKPSLKKKKKKIVIVQQSESEDDESEEEEPVKPSPKPKPNFGKSQQNIKSKITVGNQKPNWENYFC